MVRRAFVIQLTSVEEGSESTPVNGDPASEKLASELGPGCQSLEGTRNVNIESLYEVRRSAVHQADM
jgi:hypothetical protein